MHSLRPALKLKPVFPLALAFALVLSLLSAVFANPAQAATSRVAVVSEVSGTVNVKKSGGSKSYTAYKNMALNQGDYISTGDKSKVILEISDSGDEITIGSNSEVSISDLSGKKGKKSGFKMWAGSMWTKVKSLVGANDEYEVETPTAVMGVQGTQFLTMVDPLTGDTTVMVGSGVVTADVTTKNPGKEYVVGTSDSEDQQFKVLSTQTLRINNDLDGSGVTADLSIIDAEEFVRNASPEVIEAIARNKAEIDRENKEFANKWKQLLAGGELNDEELQSMEIGNNEDWNRVSTNMDNLVGIIVKIALETNKVDKAKMDKIIEEVNKKAEKPLDPNNAKPLELTDGQKKHQQDVEKKRAERQKLIDDLKKQQEELKKKNEALLKLIQEEADRQRKANEEALKKAQLDAENALLAGMTPAQRAEYLKNKAALGKTTTPSSTTGGSGGGPSGPVNPTTNSASVSWAANTNLLELQTGDTFSITMSVKDAKNLYGVEIHLDADKQLFFMGSSFSSTPVSPVEFNPAIFNTSYDNGNSVYRVDTSIYDSDEILIAATRYGNSNGANIGNSTLVTLNFMVNPFLNGPLLTSEGPFLAIGDISIISMKLVDATGTPLYIFDSSKPGNLNKLSYQIIQGDSIFPNID